MRPSFSLVGRDLFERGSLVGVCDPRPNSKGPSPSKTDLSIRLDHPGG